MVQKLEEIKGGGGSIRVGTTGTISALMTRELESIKTQAAEASSGDKHNNNNNKHTTALAVPKMQTRKSLDEEASSSSSKCSKGGGSHRIPMLRSENVTLDRTPSRDKTTNKKKKKKGTNIVEVVDIKCGHPDITSKLKKLGFSKLSDTIL